MQRNENKWDRLLNIKTTGRDAAISNQVNYPYEPTPYSVLERLGNSGYITKKSVILDYGCGKGRVDFYLAFQTRCRAIGIDYDERMLMVANHNKNSAPSGSRTGFVCANAAGFEIPIEVDVCYFFNPFSVEILKNVVVNISASYYEKPREIRLIFYYPSSEYISYLGMSDVLELEDEISCGDLFEGNDMRETILVYKVIG